MSVAGFARTEVSRRVEKLLAELRGALGKTTVDAVHDVRVANRRLRQALRLLGPLTARKQARKLRAELKVITETGGAVRDCDITMELFGEARLPGQHPLWDELRAERAQAETRFRRKMARLLRAQDKEPWAKRLRLNVRPSGPALRLPALAPLLGGYFAAGHAAARPGTPAEQLHAFRLETKRLRYTLELFRPLYGPGLQQRIEMLRRIQELLGQSHDLTVAAARLSGRAAADPVLQHPLESLERNARQLQASFLRFWREQFEDASTEVRWANYLRRRKKP
jgi:CHAD domain-containing protein